MRALLGGTFNPPHFGHLKPALHAISVLNIEKLGLMPCKIAPHKPVFIDEKHRVNMVKLACEFDERLYPELIELALPSPSYTINTLKALHKSTDERIYFLIGADSLYNLTKWFEWNALLDYCHLVVMRRDGETFTPPDDIARWVTENKAKNVNELHTSSVGRVLLVNTPLHPISSTQLRALITDSDSIDTAAKWLPEPVATYINTHHLYKS
jgi:nicotinate-nucleotide adenylyltransferase